MSHAEEAPADWLVEQAAWLPRSGRALDVACGSGRNALFLADRGLEVVGLDRDEEALDRAAERARARSLEVTWRAQELEQGWRPELDAWDLILVSRFLFRPLLPALGPALRPGGRLFYSTFSRDQRAFGRPHREDFLLAPNELLEACRGLRVRHYFDGVRGHEQASEAVVELVAERELMT